MGGAFGVEGVTGYGGDEAGARLASALGGSGFLVTMLACSVQADDLGCKSSAKGKSRMAEAFGLAWLVPQMVGGWEDQ